MTRSRFQQKIVSGRFTLPAAITLSALVWMLAWGSAPGGIPSPLYPFWQNLLGLLPANFIGEAISFLVYGTTAYLLIELNNAYSLIRVRTTFPCTVFILSVSACPFLFPLQTGSIAGLCLLAGIYFLLRTYQKQEPAGRMFRAFLFLGAGTILFPGLFFYIPLFFIGAFKFQSLTFRTFFAGVLGWLFPYWFLLGHAYFYDRMELFYEPFEQLANILPIDYTLLEPGYVLPGTLALLVAIVSAVHFWITGYEDKIRTRSFLNFIILVTIGTILFCILQPQHLHSLYPVLLSGSSLLAGHLFANTSNRISNLFFIIFLILLAGTICYNLWTTLSN